MNCTDQVLREALLAILDTNRTSFGLPVSRMRLSLREDAIAASEPEIIQALDYLASRPAHPLVEEVRPEINRQNRAWKITTAGIKYVDEHGL